MNEGKNMSTKEYLNLVTEELRECRNDLANATNVVEQSEAQERVTMFCYKLALGQENA